MAIELKRVREARNRLEAAQAALGRELLVSVVSEAVDSPKVPLLDKPGVSNWVEKFGALKPKATNWIRRAAEHLQGKGMMEGHAIAVAKNAALKLCSTGDLNFPGIQQANPGSRAQACAAIGIWDQARARANAARVTESEAPFALGETLLDDLALLQVEGQAGGWETLVQEATASARDRREAAEGKASAGDLEELGRKRKRRRRARLSEEEHHRLKCPKCDTVQSASNKTCVNCDHSLAAARRAKFAQMDSEHQGRVPSLVESVMEHGEIVEREFTAEKRRELAKRGLALPDGSYPIENAGDVSNAVSRIGTGNASTSRIKRHIVKAAKKIGATSALPDAWKVQESETDWDRYALQEATAEELPQLHSRILSARHGETVRLPDGTGVMRMKTQDNRDAYKVGRPRSYGDGGEIYYDSTERTPEKAVARAAMLSAGSSDPASIGGEQRIGRYQPLAHNGKNVRLHDVTKHGQPVIRHDDGSTAETSWSMLSPAEDRPRRVLDSDHTPGVLAEAFPGAAASIAARGVAGATTPGGGSAAVHWDPALHPRDPVGKFSHAASRLAELLHESRPLMQSAPAEVHLPSGTHVRIKEGLVHTTYHVHAPGGRKVKTLRDFSGEGRREAARVALRTHLAHVPSSTVRVREHEAGVLAEGIVSFDEAKHPRGPGGKWARAGFEHLAETIKTLGVGKADQQKLAHGFATHLGKSNPNFKRDLFVKAATEGHKGRSGTPKLTSGHFQDVADVLKTTGASEHAPHFADKLAETHPNFNRDRFLKAAGHEGGGTTATLNAMQRNEGKRVGGVHVQRTSGGGFVAGGQHHSSADSLASKLDAGELQGARGQADDKLVRARPSKQLDDFQKNQLKIARQTLRYSDAGANIMGGMTKDEARAFIRRVTGQVRESAEPPSLIDSIMDSDAGGRPEPANPPSR